MRIEYAPSFVEQSTFLALRWNPEKECEFRRAQEAVYALTDPEQRDKAFNRISGQWFLKLELEKPFRLLIAERPLIEQRVDRCLVRQAPGARKQGADLYVKMFADGTSRTCTLIVELCPDTLLTPHDLAATLRPDLLKVSDMLDEAFGYSPVLPSADRPQQNLIRDRYQALWDVYVVSRLRSEARLADGIERIACKRFSQAFTSAGAAPPAECFEVLTALMVVTHQQLLTWAATPDALPGWARDGGDQRQAGEACPLCGFPTHDWYPKEAFTEETVDRIRFSLRDWKIKNGMCRQCVETIQPVAHCEHAGGHGE